MNYPSKLLERAVYEMSRLPGIGKRTALRLILHLLQNPEEKTRSLTTALDRLTREIRYCERCHNISDQDICEVCINPHRDKQIICVVEDVRDVMAIENTGQYRGVYHVLGGKISPMDGIGPSSLNIATLLEKIKQEEVVEVIFAMSSTMEGDTTVFYIYKQIKDAPVRISTIARGISVGDELEYADEVTLGRSIKHRVPYEEMLKEQR